MQNRLIQTSQTGGQWYSNTSPFSIPRSDIKTFDKLMNRQKTTRRIDRQRVEQNVFLIAIGILNTKLQLLCEAVLLDGQREVVGLQEHQDPDVGSRVTEPGVDV